MRELLGADTSQARQKVMLTPAERWGFYIASMKVPMNLEQLRALAVEADRLHESIYDQSMTAAIQGQVERSDRFKKAAEKAFRRYERRHHAFCSAQARDS